MCTCLVLCVTVIDNDFHATPVITPSVIRQNRWASLLSVLSPLLLSSPRPSLPLTPFPSFSYLQLPGQVISLEHTVSLAFSLSLLPNPSRLFNLTFLLHSFPQLILSPDTRHPLRLSNPPTSRPSAHLSLIILVHFISTLFAPASVAPFSDFFPPCSNLFSGQKLFIIPASSFDSSFPLSSHVFPPYLVYLSQLNSFTVIMYLGSLPPSAVSPLFICISFCAVFVSWLCFSVPSGRLTPCPNPAETCHAKMTTRESQGRGCFTGHLKSAAPWKRPECVRVRVCERECVR